MGGADGFMTSTVCSVTGKKHETNNEINMNVRYHSMRTLGILPKEKKVKCSFQDFRRLSMANYFCPISC